MWQDDIQQLKYTSPSGKEFIFQYENLSIEVDKKTTEFQFAEKDGVYIQDNGRAGRSFPFTLFFVGEDYNITADNFLLALEEKGIGKLEHPLYGNRDVIPTGKITRRDDLINEANQAVFSITFSETIKDIFFPSSTADAVSNVGSALTNVQVVIAEKFSLNIILSKLSDKSNLATRMTEQLQILASKFNKLIEFASDVKAQFDTIKTSVENTVNEVFDLASTIKSQIITLIRLPAKIITDAKTKIQTYINYIDDILADFGISISINNYFETASNYMTGIAASCESVLNSYIPTRNLAIELSEKILIMFDDLKDFQDEYLTELSIIDSGEDYQALSELISQITGYLIALSFSLPSEKSIILGEERNIIELCSEIYGDIDRLDYFIGTNDFTADEIEILPAGKEVIYYE